MHDLFLQEALADLLQVVMIDLTLAGDNAIVIGLAAASLPREQRNKAILVGIVAATALRIVFAGLATQLLQIVGLLLAGGILLIWVCWKMWRELRLSHHEVENAAATLTGRIAALTRQGRLQRPVNPSPRRPGRSLSPMSRCRSTMCSRSPAPPASIPSF